VQGQTGDTSRENIQEEIFGDETSTLLQTAHMTTQENAKRQSQELLSFTDEHGLMI